MKITNLKIVNSKVDIVNEVSNHYYTDNQLISAVLNSETQKKITNLLRKIKGGDRYSKESIGLLMEVWKEIKGGASVDLDEKKLAKTLFKEEDRHVEFDAFLSFSEEDGEFAEKLYSQLSGSDLNIWFSRQDLAVGDSIIGIISEAILNSRSAIVLLSPHTFSDTHHFPIKELNLITNHQMYSGKKIYPIYHGIDHQFLLRQKALIQDTLAFDTRKQTLVEIAEKLCSVIRKS